MMILSESQVTAIHPPSRLQDNTLRNARHVDQDRENGRKVIIEDTQLRANNVGYDVYIEPDYGPSTTEVFHSEFEGPTVGGNGWTSPYDAGRGSESSLTSYGIDHEVAQHALDTNSSIAESLQAMSRVTVQINGKFVE